MSFSQLPGKIASDDGAIRVNVEFSQRRLGESLAAKLLECQSWLVTSELIKKSAPHLKPAI